MALSFFFFFYFLIPWSSALFLACFERKELGRKIVEDAEAGGVPSLKARGRDSFPSVFPGERFKIVAA